MSNRTLRLTGLALLPLTLALACTHTNNDVQPVNPPPGGGGGGGNTADTALCFERDILPIFISNCAKSGCHDAASRQDGYEFTSYQTITAKKFTPGNPSKTELYEKITEDDHEDRMPPPPNAPLSRESINLIYSWIARGAPNTTGCRSGCDSNAYTFSASIQPLLNQYCKGCHNTVTASGGVMLDSYNGAKTVATSGKLLQVINHAPGVPAMPQGGNKLSACQIKQVAQWINAGALNN